MPKPYCSSTLAFHSSLSSSRGWAPNMQTCTGPLGWTPMKLCGHLKGLPRGIVGERLVQQLCCHICLVGVHRGQPTPFSWCPRALWWLGSFLCLEGFLISRLNRRGVRGFSALASLPGRRQMVRLRNRKALLRLGLRLG